jgi:hypothetical protein
MIQSETIISSFDNIKRSYSSIDVVGDIGNEILPKDDDIRQMIESENAEKLIDEYESTLNLEIEKGKY